MFTIDHIALWVKDPERMKAFYETYFNAVSGPLYENPKTGFRSYFLTFASGPRLELMHCADVMARPAADLFGYAHIALSVGSPEKVNEMAQTLENAGFVKLSGPRSTGDGFYEAAFKDPEGHTLEITV